MMMMRITMIMTVQTKTRIASTNDDGNKSSYGNDADTTFKSKHDQDNTTTATTTVTMMPSEQTQKYGR